jgi:hypothetical protein
MRKAIILFFIVFVIFPAILFASVIGGAETVGKGKIGVGLDADYVFDKKFENKSYTGNKHFFYDFVAPPATGILRFQADPDKTEVNYMYKSTVKLSYGILDNLDIYARLGTSEGSIKQEYTGYGTYTVAGFSFPTSILDGNLTYKTENSFLYGGGIKGSYEFLKGWLVGCDAQYLRYQNDYTARNYFTLMPQIPMAPAYFSEMWEGSLDIQEWQVATYVAKEIWDFVLYTGVKYSDSRVVDHPDQHRIDKGRIYTGGAEAYFSDNNQNEKPYTQKWSSDFNVGPFIGLDYKIGNKWVVNLEGRFVDETAASFSAAYKF